MRNLVERFRKIKYCHVYLISRVRWLRYIICCHEQLGFTRSFSMEPMLVFMKNVLRVKMIHYLWNNYMFKHFGNYNCQWDWLVIFRFESASFLKIGTTFACFQSRGTSTADSDCWNILVKIGVISLEHCFKTLIGILSGPLALFSFKRSMHFWLHFHLQQSHP